ncbi:MAG: hypothetical protein HOV81_30795 [Kofleriaceae bacterium]|nr:hypothetical protein [Kofleriaceae bacterium]
MIKSSLVVALLCAIGMSAAHAQPGQTPPSEPRPERDPAIDPTDGVQAPPPSDSVFDPDTLVERAIAASPTLEKIARGTFRRARRAISIGPTIGVYGASIVSPGEADAALTFGLGIETFKVPVLPSIENFQELVKERAKAKLVEQVALVFKGQRPEATALDQLVREVIEEAVQEVLGLDNIRPKTMERPSLTLAVEGNRYFDSNVWMTRLRLGIGIWKLTLAGSVSAAFTDPKTSVFAGPEVVAHFLTSRNPRASVLDVFLRADFELRNRGTMNTDTMAVGVRYLVDVL